MVTAQEIWVAPDPESMKARECAKALASFKEGEKALFHYLYRKKVLVPKLVLGFIGSWSLK